MSRSTLVVDPVAGQSPYSEATITAAQRTVAEHWKLPTLRGYICAVCKDEWGPNGCPAVLNAITSFRVPDRIEIEWRTVAPPQVPEIAFDYDADATQVLYLDPELFERADKPRPYPRPKELVGAAA